MTVSRLSVVFFLVPAGVLCGPISTARADIPPSTLPSSAHCQAVGAACSYAGAQADQTGICERAADCSQTPDPTLCLVCIAPSVAAKQGGCQLAASIGAGAVGVLMAAALRRLGRRPKLAA